MNDILLIVLFATIAALVGVRLYMVLGRRSEDEPAIPPASNRQFGPPTTSPLDEEEVVFTGPGSAVLEAIRADDGVFHPDDFLSGAVQAYAMISESFAKGDRETLRGLLSEPVFNTWSDAITEREQAGRTQFFELKSMEAASIDDAELENGVARIDVEFEADIITYIKDSSGELLDGDPDLSRRVREIWSFERPIKTDRPDWTLVEVKAG